MNKKRTGIIMGATSLSAIAISSLFFPIAAHAEGNSTVKSINNGSTAEIVSSSLIKDANSNGILEKGDIYQTIVKYTFGTASNTYDAGGAGAATCDKGQVNPATGAGKNQMWSLGTVNAGDVVTCTYVFDTSDDSIWNSLGFSPQTVDNGKLTYTNDISDETANGILPVATIQTQVDTSYPNEVASATPTDSASATPTDSASATPTDSASATPTDSASTTPTDSASATPTDSATPTSSATATPTDSASPTGSATATPTNSATPTSSPTAKMLTISGTIFNDLNANGIQDPGENFISNAKVELLNTDGSLIQTVVADTNGKFSLNNVADGNYVIRSTNPLTGVTTDWILNVADGKFKVSAMSVSSSTPSSVTSTTPTSNNINVQGTNGVNNTVSTTSSQDTSDSAGYNKGTSVKTGEVSTSIDPVSIALGAGISSAAGLSFLLKLKKRNND